MPTFSRQMTIKIKNNHSMITLSLWPRYHRQSLSMLLNFGITCHLRTFLAKDARMSPTPVVLPQEIILKV